MSGAPAIPAAEVGTLGRIDRFDEILNKPLVFPDPTERDLYDELPRSSDGERRAYAFALLMQPGMVLNQHFHLITVTISPLRPGPHDAGMGVAGTGGPNGGFVGAKAATRDGAFEVAVSIGMSLPNTVSIRELDPHDLAANVAGAYDSRF